jgi:hypothetical protein
MPARARADVPVLYPDGREEKLLPNCSPCSAWKRATEGPVRIGVRRTEHNADHLADFWNLRTVGVDALFWPTTLEEDRLEDRARGLRSR